MSASIRNVTVHCLSVLVCIVNHQPWKTTDDQQKF